MQKFEAYTICWLCKKDRGLGTGRCEMSFLSVVCSHPGEAHKADKAERLFTGRLVQVSVWECYKLARKWKDVKRSAERSLKALSENMPKERLKERTVNCTPVNVIQDPKSGPLVCTFPSLVL